MTEPGTDFEPTHVVTGPLALVTDEAGMVRYLYEGTPLPEDTSDDSIEHLETVGLIRPVKPGTLEPIDDEEWKAFRRAKADELERERSGGDVERSDDEPPLSGESKVRWVDYAVSRGMDHETAMDMTKGELIERYGAG